MRWPAKIGLAVMVMLAAVSLAQGVRNALRPEGSQDNQWGPSRALLHHQNPYRLSLDHREHPDTPAPFMMTQDPCYPVSGLVMLWPYAIFPWSTAKVLWVILNVLFTAIIVVGLFRLFPPARPPSLMLLIACLFVTSTPHRNLIGNGQHALFSLAFFVLSLMLIEKDKGIWSGICLAVSLFKYTVTIPLLPFFFMKRRWGVVLLALGIHVGLTLFAAAWVHESPVNLLLGPVQVAFQVTPRGYVDVRAIFEERGWTSWKYLWAFAALALLAGATATCQLYGKKQQLLTLSVLAILSLVVFYHLPYDAIVLIFALFYLLRGERNQHRESKLSVLLALCIAFSWYVDKAVFLLQSKSSSPALQQLCSGYRCLIVLLFYGTLTYGLFALRARGTPEQ